MHYLGLINKQDMVSIYGFSLTVLNSGGYILGLGINSGCGAVYAININYFMHIIIVIIIMWKAEQFPKLILNQNLKMVFEYLKEVFLIAAPFEIDQISTDFASFMIGGLNLPNQLTATLVFNSILNIIYSVPMGMGQSLLQNISGAVGEKNVGKVKKIFFTGFFMAVGFSLVTGLGLYFFRKQIIQFFVPDNQAVQNSFFEIVRIYSFGLVFDFTQMIIGCGIKAVGKADEISIAFLVIYYIGGIPLGVFLGIKEKLGVYGFWIASDINFYLISLFIIYLYYTIDWQKQVSDMAKEIKNHEEQLQENNK
ncbi:hypothetical protein PPERSA_09278 [Pseudocohnilembus persalinus]|uniref:Multi antimicrobial extrusion protein n=1 Tax=Pseudocohnilembus persalinus TaxID=266149 RepID=A0A0V0QLU5_PSEPJ|nr:hypothetical protein PPERSA_09278 [Pseudocohnilembus persalinus]|eukprot:KRX03218.1 hypothetical protein PPERSA_09278 [Pseudocohnilembus persalinus]